jgi:RHS repeat-associated protein
MQMQLSSDVRIPEGLLAANALLAENSRQGFGASTHTLYQGFGVSISSTPLGIIGPLYDAGIGSRYTGKERDAESGLDYFGARYYASNMGRWMSPDWSVKPEAVPYSSLDNPQSLNLYGYVNNNPLRTFDPDGHNGFTDFFKNTFQRLDNAFHGNGFITNAQRTTITTTQTYNYLNNIHNTSEDPSTNEALHNYEPKPSVTAATDAAGIAGLAASEKVAKPLGRVGAAASILNDPSLKNITINVLGQIPGFEGPFAVTGAFNDFLDYGINNSTPGPKKAYGSDQLTPTPPTQDGGCLAAGLPSC